MHMINKEQFHNPYGIRLDMYKSRMTSGALVFCGAFIVTHLARFRLNHQ